MKLKTGISPLYVKEWDIEKAIREIIQNYLDARQEFKVKGRVDYRNGGVTIHDFGPGLEPKHLALGISEKTEDLRGKFGEGLKLALLVFAREGREIVVRSRGQEIRPLIEFDEGFETEVLVLEIVEADTPKGTQVKFPCTREELDAGKSYFVEFKRQQKEYRKVADRITLPGGSIYINGTKVGDIPDALYSYHLLESEVEGAGNRDRTIVDMAKVEPAIAMIIESTASGEVIENILNKLSSCWEGTLFLSTYRATTNSKAWKRGFYRVFGENAVLSSGIPSVDSQADYNGYSVAFIPHSWAFFFSGIGIPRAGEHQSKNKKPKRVAMRNISDEERRNLNKSIILCEHYYHSPGNVVVVDSMFGFLGNDSNALPVAGYDREEDTIYITKGLLKDAKKLLHALLHETVHKVTGYQDRTEQFEDALLSIAVENIMKG